MIGVAGLSHLGINTAAAIAARGFNVIGFDPRPELIHALNSGEIPFFEPGLAELTQIHRERLQYTNDVNALKECDVIIFALDVATDEHGLSDISALISLIRNVTSNSGNTHAPHVVMSQVSPGFTRRIARDVSNVCWIYQVETLIFGNAVERALNPERFIIGVDDPQQRLPIAYEKLLSSFNCPLLPMRYESAELTKISINLFLTSSVTVTNTISEICEKIGADWSEIAPALKLDRRIGPFAYLQPGLGIAGGNLERDLATITNLAAIHGTEVSTVSAWRRNSQHRRDWLIRSVHSHILRDNSNATIALWGLAYKPDTTSLKNSPGIHLVNSFPDVRFQAFDPQAKPDSLSNLKQLDDPIECCKNANALVIATAWKEFRSIPVHEISKKLNDKIVLDPFGVLSAAECCTFGLSQYRLGTT